VASLNGTVNGANATPSIPKPAQTASVEFDSAGQVFTRQTQTVPCDDSLLHFLLTSQVAIVTPGLFETIPVFRGAAWIACRVSRNENANRDRDAIVPSGPVLTEPLRHFPTRDVCEVSDAISVLRALISWQVANLTPGLYEATQNLPYATWAKSYYESQRTSLSTIAGQREGAQQNEVAQNGNRPVAEAADVVTNFVTPKDVTVPSNFMYVRFSKSFLQTRFCKQFDKTLPVHDVILGACVSGTARTIAHTELQLVDNPRQAQFVLLFRGKTWFNTVASTWPVHIQSSGSTRFITEKDLWFDGVNVQQTSAHSSAETDTITGGITTDLPRLRGRISLRIASRREANNHDLAECITSQRTISKIEPAFNHVAMQRANDFMQNLGSQYAKLPFEDRFTITGVQCSTTLASLQIIVFCSGDKKVTFVTAPDFLADQPDIEIHVHKTLLQLAIVDSELRQALQAAVSRLVNPASNADSTVDHLGQNLGPELEVHWAGDAGSEWLTLACYARSTSESSESNHSGNQR
jgi:hypothetical protein